MTPSRFFLVSLYLLLALLTILVGGASILFLLVAPTHWFLPTGHWVGGFINVTAGAYCGLRIWTEYDYGEELYGRIYDLCYYLKNFVFGQKKKKGLYYTKPRRPISIPNKHHRRRWKE